MVEISEREFEEAIEVDSSSAVRKPFAMSRFTRAVCFRSDIDLVARPITTRRWVF